MRASRNPDSRARLLGKKKSGKETFQAAFLLRPPGMDDEVEVGAGGNTSYHCWAEEDSLGLLGALPEFPESIETVRARSIEVVGHVAVPHKVLTWHPAIDRLLKFHDRP